MWIIIHRLEQTIAYPSKEKERRNLRSEEWKIRYVLFVTFSLFGRGSGQRVYNGEGSQDGSQDLVFDCGAYKRTLGIWEPRILAIPTLCQVCMHIHTSIHTLTRTSIHPRSTGYLQRKRVGKHKIT